MALHPLAGKPATKDMLVNVPRLVASYYTLQPDANEPGQRVSFGTSGHRGCALTKSFNEAHILATTQAICEYRRLHQIQGPLFLGMDTHALSEAAYQSALEVLRGNSVDVVVQTGNLPTPTPVISHAILTHNENDPNLADGIVITPSHNPPQDGGFKYNPPNGGPADTEATDWIEKRANELLAAELDGVHAISFEEALSEACEEDLMAEYVDDLASVVDMRAIADKGVRIGVDAMGGAGGRYWQAIAQKYGLDITVRNAEADPTFAFMTVDKDGKIRMDCSSASAMASLIELKDKFDIAVANDPDYDRHGIVAPSVGLMNPNHYLSVAIDYLISHRPQWRDDLKIGKTLVSSGMIDRVAGKRERQVAEVPVGFKWFVDGLFDGDFAFAGEESAGASFLRKNGDVWSTDKDGIILALLAAEIIAVTGKDPGQHYLALEAEFGQSHYHRMDAPANGEQKAKLKGVDASSLNIAELAGEPVIQILSEASFNQAKIGGIKVVTENGWFAARPSGTEDIYKIYSESFKGPEHLTQIQAQAQQIVNDIFAS